jgi:hypothetical protein
MGRLGEDHVLVEDDVLGISAAVSESKDLLAGMPLAAGCAAVFDDARELNAQRRRRLGGTGYLLLVQRGVRSWSFTGLERTSETTHPSRWSRSIRFRPNALI